MSQAGVFSRVRDLRSCLFKRGFLADVKVCRHIGSLGFRGGRFFAEFQIVVWERSLWRLCRGLFHVHI